ncbi:uncharacterized protein LOC125374222 [Haliotis rufescens]|uniref:uncharacterized protein LOC125374222 n=1 Tax=Haliotis rufescens TaxID=6454 RepID=UPI00201F76CD|nr:uncharacterized protein LOC125374222 [Haliotis rufescens]
MTMLELRRARNSTQMYIYIADNVSEYLLCQPAGGVDSFSMASVNIVLAVLLVLPLTSVIAQGNLDAGAGTGWNGVSGTGYPYCCTCGAHNVGLCAALLVVSLLVGVVFPYRP